MSINDALTWSGTGCSANVATVGVKGLRHINVIDRIVVIKMAEFTVYSFKLSPSYLRKSGTTTE